jgi:16S rRNA (uracil1498-N3)-methyltransferase
LSRRRIHVPASRLDGTVARPDAAALHHLQHVLRLGPGAEVEVFDGEGNAWDASFTGTELRLGARRPAPAPAAVVWIAFALPRGEKADWVVQKATELGVARLVPWQAERSVVRLEGRRAAERAERWRRIAAEAARQCGRSEVPEVAEPGPLAAALWVPDGFERLVLHAGAGEGIAARVRRGAPGHAALVGPEGGLTEGELEAARTAGFAPVAVGPRVLRAETAAVAVAALLQHLAGDLG